MEEQVRVLYEFSAEPGSTELSVSAGSILRVVRRDVGAGWLEARDHRGAVGLVPEAYCETIDGGSHLYAEPDPGDPWDSNWQQQQQQQKPPAVPAGEVQAGYGGYQGSFEQQDDWDDDFEDDSETGSTITHATANSQMHTMTTGTPGMHATGVPSAVGKRTFNPFSSFAKSGGESYILGTLKLNSFIPENDIIKIYDNKPNGPIEWEPIQEPYSCAIASPKKESKLRGLKSYIAYQLTPTFSNIQVSRRYKQFDWLHERLQEKYSIIPIPPLPDKQVSGRFDEDFIEHRRVQLQAFVNCVCRHPVLSRSPVWLHFIACTDERKWKAGKRKAERDELIGAALFLALRPPSKPLDPFLVDQETEDCAKFIHASDHAVKGLLATAQEQTKKMQTLYNKDQIKIGQVFESLAHSFDLDKTVDNPLNNAIMATASAYNNVGKIIENQPRNDWEPLADVLHIYKGIIGQFPDILTLHKNAVTKRKECEKDLTGEAARNGLRARTDVVSYALLSEITHFHRERANDFKVSMHSFLTQQINYYQKIVTELQTALRAYEY